MYHCVKQEKSFIKKLYYSHADTSSINIWDNSVWRRPMLVTLREVSLFPSFTVNGSSRDHFLLEISFQGYCGTPFTISFFFWRKKALTVPMLMYMTWLNHLYHLRRCCNISILHGKKAWLRKMKEASQSPIATKKLIWTPGLAASFPRCFYSIVSLNRSPRFCP